MNETQGPDIPQEVKGQILEVKRLEEGRNELFEQVAGVAPPPQVAFQYDDRPVDSIEGVIKLISSRSMRKRRHLSLSLSLSVSLSDMHE